MTDTHLNKFSSTSFGCSCSGGDSCGGFSCGMNDVGWAKRELDIVEAETKKPISSLFPSSTVKTIEVVGGGRN